MNYQVLSLSGGGARGLYTTQVLADLERYLQVTAGKQASLSNHFDLICGTSIGGLLALALAQGTAAHELLRKFDEHRQRIFPPGLTNSRIPGLAPLSRWRRYIKQARTSLYASHPLRDLLDDIFEDRTLGNLEKRVLIPAVNYSTGKVQVFKTPHHRDFSSDWRLRLTDVALATSAAPTFFPMHEIDNSWYADGGLAANSPAYMGVHEVRKFCTNDEVLERGRVKLLSIGTMGQRRTVGDAGTRSRGYIHWGMGRTLIDLTLSSTEELHNQLAAHALGQENCLFLDDPPSPDTAGSIAIDNSSDAAAALLKATGKARARSAVNEALFQELIAHTAETPDFYFGAHRKIENDSEI